MGFNLSATFLLQFELNKVLKALEFADYVFCNEDEADVFAETQKLKGGRHEVAKVLCKWKKANKSRTRVAIVTQGPLPVLVAS